MTSFHDRLTQQRRDFHRNPELGLQEHRTKQIVADRLRALGIETHEGVGVVGILKKGTGNRAIALRADMDALPIAETSGHDYPSQSPGVMHACGHDGHTTMLLGAAEILIQDTDFDGTVVLLFQPDEEHGTGAQAMLNEAVLDRFPFEEVFAIHNFPNAPLGEVSTRVGMMCSSESLFDLTITGQGGHASMPQVGVEALTVGAELVLALQTIVSRKLAPGSGAVVSITEFLTDGQRNVLPGQVTLKGEVRARSPQDRKNVEKYLRQISAGVAAAHDVQVSMTFETGFVETINAREPTEAVVRAAQTAGRAVIPDCPTMSFSEDFAHFSNAVPGCFLLLGNGTEGAHAQPLHASDYDFNDALLPIGAHLWVELVKDRLPVRKGQE